MKRFYLSAFLILMLLSLLTACGGPKEPPVTEDGDLILARYRDEVITQSEVDFRRAYMEWSEDDMSDREITEHLLRPRIYGLEAEARGFTATEEEIETFLDETIYASYDIEEGKAQIDEYLAAEGISFEEYVERVRETAPDVILIAKLEESIAADYAREHDIELEDPMFNVPNEVKDAVNAEMDNILKKAQKEITYYI